MFLINKEKCIEFLEKEGLNLFWIAYNNKHIVGDYFEDRNIRYDINGFFWLKNKKIEGKLGVIDVWYPSIKKEFKNYKLKTGKNAIWRGKITKKFKQWYYNKIEK